MHRIATASAVGTLLAAAVIGVSAFGGSAPARANLRSPPPLCQAGPITINDGGPASPYPSSCLQQALPGAISDVNVSIYGLNHTYPDDIDMLLVSPDGQNVTFLSDVGGDTDVVGCGLSIDDEREQALPDTGGILCHAAYRPADYEPGDLFPAPAPVPGGNVDLSTFDGGPPNGTWSLYVVDDRPGDSGTIVTGWSVWITPGGPPAPPPPPPPPPAPPPPPPPSPPPPAPPPPPPPRRNRRRHHHRLRRHLRLGAASPASSGCGSEPRRRRFGGHTARSATSAASARGVRCVAVSSRRARGRARSSAGTSRSSWLSGGRRRLLRCP